MNELVFASVADDDTGASDLAGMLAGHELRTLLVIDLPTAEQFGEWSAGYHAIVMAEGTRNLTSRQAYERTRAALRIVAAQRPRVVQIKYCSTFDSTPEGNIGASIDAALDETGEEFTIALPALPVLGRTTYQGYHFVRDRLLSDSSMRDHPLTPMTNPYLVDLLSRQTDRKVGLAAYADVSAGADRLRRRFDELRGEGAQIALVDCLDDRHLETICRAAADLRVITGSSAFGVKSPEVWRERGWLTDAHAGDDRPVNFDSDRGCLVVAGSCSSATIEQNKRLRGSGVSATDVSPVELVSGALGRARLVSRVRDELRAGRDHLLTTTAAPEEVREVQTWGADKGLDVPALGRRIAADLADLVFEMLEDSDAAGLVVAGGETSGAICRRLELGALRVGRNIEPGVPLCFSLGRFRVPVVLKSGNFGDRDFYSKALRAVRRTNDFMF